MTLLGELHSTFARTADIQPTGDDQLFFRAGTFLNVGALIKLTENYTILTAIGKDLESPPLSSDDANFYGYIGFQLKM